LRCQYVIARAPLFHVTKGKRLESPKTSLLYQYIGNTEYKSDVSS